MWRPLLSERLLHVNLNDVEVQEAEVELAPEALADPDTEDPGGPVFLGGRSPGRPAALAGMAWRVCPPDPSHLLTLVSGP